MMTNRRIAWTLALASVAGLVHAQEGSDAGNLRWMAGMTERPELHGVPSNEGSRKKAAPGNYDNYGYYTTLGLSGILVAALTEAIVGSAVQSAEAKRQRARDDKVVLPYVRALQALSSDDLLLRTQEQVALRGELPAKASLELRPVFLMTQDERAILMDVVAQFSDGSGTPSSTMGMRVVSDPREGARGADDWAAADGSGLRRVFVGLLSRAAQHLTAHFVNAGDAVDANAPAAVERTVRYVQGGTQGLERATVLEQRCGRALLRTLSNTLMSVPLTATPPAEAGCETAPAAVSLPAPAATASAPTPGA